MGIVHTGIDHTPPLILVALVSKLSTNSTHQNYFTARQVCEQSLRQAEFVDHGNSCDEIANIEAMDIKLLHLLPLNLCGKITVITPLMLVS
jgi:hypothetical protein